MVDKFYFKVQDEEIETSTWQFLYIDLNTLQTLVFNVMNCAIFDSLSDVSARLVL